MFPTSATAATFFLLAVVPSVVHSHGYLSNPRPRQFRTATSEWWTINVHDNGAFLRYGNTNPPNNDVANLNGVRGGAASNSETSGYAEGDHGLCGDKGDRMAFMAGGAFGPQPPTITYEAGGVARIHVAITAYHAGHFEFRLAVPADGGADRTIPITQQLLNEHVLEIAPSTPYYAAVVDYKHMKGFGGYTGHGGEFKCTHTGGHNDATATSPQLRWPHGSCCNGGGACSDPAHNTDRYVVEYGVAGYDKPAARGDFQTTYTVDLKIPAGIQCERCVLQWTYQTANSADGWPETFYNCADVRVINNGATHAATGAPITTGAPAPITTTSTAASPVVTTTASAQKTTAIIGDCESSPVAAWSKCGGEGWTGSTCCVPGYVCSEQSRWYSQCTPGAAAPPATPAPPAPASATTTTNVMTSTVITTAASPPPVVTTTAAPKTSVGCESPVGAWAKCGGQGWAGSTCCVSNQPVRGVPAAAPAAVASAAPKSLTVGKYGLLENETFFSNFADADVDDLISTPCPQNQLALASIVRSGTSKTKVNYFTMSMETEDKAGNREVLYARRQRHGKAISYVISTENLKAVEKGGKMASITGKLKANVKKDKFVIYDGGNKKKGARKEICNIVYTAKSWSNPRGLMVRVDGGAGRDITFVNALPEWDPIMKVHSLKFNGRATEVSVKNFKLVKDGVGSQTVGGLNQQMYLRMGKVGKHTFNIDFRAPYSPVQAFGIALSSFEG